MFRYIHHEVRDPGRDHVHSKPWWEHGEGRQQGQGTKATGPYLTPGKCFSFSSPKPERKHSPLGRVRASRQVPGTEQRGDSVRAVENGTWLLTGGRGSAEPLQPPPPAGVPRPWAVAPAAKQGSWRDIFKLVEMIYGTK